MLEYGRRTYRCTHHGLETRRTRLSAAARGLPRPADLLALASQRYDLAAGRLSAGLERNAAVHERDLTRASARLTPALLQAPARAKSERLAGLSVRLGAAGRRLPEIAARRARLPDLEERLAAAVLRRLSRAAERLGHLDQMRASLDPDRPLVLGFARVHRGDGRLARSGGELSPGEALSLVFADRTPVAAHVDGAASTSARPTRRTTPALAQGDLF